MGNPDGKTWLTKTRSEKEKDIQKYFVDSKIRILKNKIKNIEKEIINCEGQIGQLIRPVLQEEIVYTKNSAKKVKEEIKKVQGKIVFIKAKRRGREDYKEIKEIKKWLKYEGELLTKEQMTDIIKRGL